MKVLVLASQKGGVGKSTIAASLAAVARQAKEPRVVAVDLDPQGSLAEWGRVRRDQGHNKGDAEIVFRHVQPDALDRWFAEMRQVPGDSLIILDTPGTFGPEVDVALRHADFVLVPVRPSAFDIKAAVPTVGRLRAMRRAFGFLINAAHAGSPGRTQDAVEALQHAGPVAPPISDRLPFRDSVATGKGVTEIDASSRATAEIVALWRWTVERLREGHNG